MVTKIRVGLVGVSGYTGMELTRLLVKHPAMELVRATSRQEAGRFLGDLYPFLYGMPLGTLQITDSSLADLAASCDVVFLAVPHSAAMEIGAELAGQGIKVVDLSADFRLRDKAVYKEWYNVEHTRFEWLNKAVYGIPEFFAKDIAQATLIANPGCYPTATLFGVYPAIKDDLIQLDDIIIDAKSGMTGAGRGAKVGSLFCEVADSFKAYSLAAHRHTPEIEQELARMAGVDSVRVSFNPHLLPINRGILATIYTRPKNNVDLAIVRAAYVKAYENCPFIRVLPEGCQPELRNVRGTMLCDIGLVHDPRTQRLIITSAIDNLCRGASGQALANANLMCNLPYTTGLEFAPLCP